MLWLVYYYILISISYIIRSTDYWVYIIACEIIADGILIRDVWPNNVCSLNIYILFFFQTLSQCTEGNDMVSNWEIIYMGGFGSSFSALAALYYIFLSMFLIIGV